MKKIALAVILLVNYYTFGQELKTPILFAEYVKLNTAEKVEYVYKCFREGYNITYLYADEFVKAGGRDIIPFILQELPKYEFWRYEHKDNRIDFLFNAICYLHLYNALSREERYKFAMILEGKALNYVKKYQEIDMGVRGINVRIWVLLDSNYEDFKSSDEIQELLLLKYGNMGALKQ